VPVPKLSRQKSPRLRLALPQQHRSVQESNNPSASDVPQLNKASACTHEQSRDVVSQQLLYTPVAAFVSMGRLRSWSQYPAQKLDVLPNSIALAEAAMASRKSAPCRSTPSMR
jgi:hypothetical protein